MAAEPGALAVSGFGPTPPTSFPWTRCAETVSQPGPYCFNAAYSSLLSPLALQRAQEVLTNHSSKHTAWLGAPGVPRTPGPGQALPLLPPSSRARVPPRGPLLPTGLRTAGHRTSPT